MISAKKFGTATITAHYGTHSVTCPVKVYVDNALSLSASNSSKIATVASKGKITAKKK